MTDTLTWLERCKLHYAHPCYANDNYDDVQMLDEMLAAAEHGYQHDACSISFNLERTMLLIDGLILGGSYSIIIPLDDLAQYGYVPKPNQTAVDFVQDNWNWY